MVLTRPGLVGTDLSLWCESVLDSSLIFSNILICTHTINSHTQAHTSIKHTNMGSKHSTLSETDCKTIIKRFPMFNHVEIERLYERFKQLDKDKKGFLDEEDLFALPEFAMNPLSGIVLDYLVSYACRDDAVGDDTITVKGNPNTNAKREIDFLCFCSLFAVFHVNTSVDKKVEFVYKAVSKATPEGLLQVLSAMVGDHLEEDQLRGIASRLHAQLDRDGDGTVSLLDFKSCMERICQTMSIDHVKV